MSASHLLSLSVLHAAAPGVLNVIFGADGDFEGAPTWSGPLGGAANGRPTFVLGVGLHLDMPMLHTMHLGRGRLAGMQHIDGLFLDCRIPSVAARLAGLCAKTAPDADTRRRLQIMFGDLRKPMSMGDAVALASLTLALADRIGALGTP